MFKTYRENLFSNRPADVSRFEFNHHVAINCICLFVFFFLFVSSLFFFAVDEKRLLWVNALGFICWLAILKYNLRHHKLCFAMMCASIILANCVYLFTFGWDAGFQNYLASLSIFILLHALINRVYLYLISFLTLALYIFLYYCDIHVDKYAGSSIAKILYLVNSLFAYCILHLAFINKFITCRCSWDVG